MKDPLKPRRRIRAGRAALSGIGRWFRQALVPLSIGCSVALGLLVTDSAPSAALSVPSAPPSNSAISAVLYDPVTGQVLYDQHDVMHMAPASTTKLMTALLVVTHDPDLNRVVTITPAEAAVGGSSSPMAAGEHITLRNLLYGLLLVSGNDAAVTLATATAGSVPKFVAMMNREAKVLHAPGTHFANPDGLPNPDHYTTALGLARIAAADLKEPEILRVLETEVMEHYPLPSGGTAAMVNQDQLLWNFPGILGGKIGYTEEAGNTMVAMARRHGTTLIAVVLHDVPWQLFQDERNLLDYGFARYRTLSLVAPGIVVKRLPVRGEAHRRIAVETVGSLKWDVVQGTPLNETTRVVLPRSLKPREKRGVEVGHLVVRVNGQTVGSVPLALARNVPALPPPSPAWPNWLEALVALLVAGGAGWRITRQRKRALGTAVRRRRRYRIRRNAGRLRSAGGRM